jgi:hypothetical protein
MECISSKGSVKSFREEKKDGTKDPINFEKMNQEFHRSRSTDREVTRATTGGKEYRSLFYPGQSHVELSNDGFRNIAEYFQAVASQQRDSRLREAKTEARTNVVGTGVSGGFAVPEAFTEILMDRALLAMRFSDRGHWFYQWTGLRCQRRDLTVMTEAEAICLD